MASVFQHTPLGRLSVDEVCAWLTELGLTKYNKEIRDNDVDGATLVTLCEDNELSALGITSKIHSARLRGRVRERLKDEASVQPSVAAYPEVFYPHPVEPPPAYNEVFESPPAYGEYGQEMPASEVLPVPEPSKTPPPKPSPAAADPNWDPPAKPAVETATPAGSTERCRRILDVLNGPLNQKEGVYKELYKAMKNDWEDPLVARHFQVEGSVEYKMVFFIPRRAPFNLFEKKTKKANFHLFVQSNFIGEIELFPDYLNFVVGAFNSEDLPRKCTVETLENSKILKIVARSAKRQVVSALLELQDNPEEFDKFSLAFSKSIKLAIYEDAQARQKWAQLIRVASTASKLTSLRAYVKRMKPQQKHILFLTGPDLGSASRSPFLEGPKKKGFEVLLLVDPIDEYMSNVLKEFDGLPMVNVSKTLELRSEEEKAADSAKDSEFQPLCRKAKEILGTQVKDVVLSHRLVDSACCIASGDHGWSANMERIMRAQAVANPDLLKYMKSTKTLELNPSHRLVVDLKRKFDAEPNSAAVSETVLLLFDTALLASGFPTNNAKVAQRMQAMLSRAQ